MLTNESLSVLRNKGIEETEIEKIASYDVNTGKAVYKDGRERTVTEVMERCMGYFSPIERWNIGKRQEHKERKHFNQKIAIAKCDNDLKKVAE